MATVTSGPSGGRQDWQRDVRERGKGALQHWRSIGSYELLGAENAPSVSVALNSRAGSVGAAGPSLYFAVTGVWLKMAARGFTTGSGSLWSLTSGYGNQWESFIEPRWFRRIEPYDVLEPDPPSASRLVTHYEMVEPLYLGRPAARSLGLFAVSATCAVGELDGEGELKDGDVQLTVSIAGFVSDAPFSVSRLVL